MIIIDSHTHLGLNGFCKTGTEPFKYDLENKPECLIHNMDKYHVEKSIILPIPGKNYDSKLSNQYLVDAKNMFPNRFIPFCKLDDNLKENILAKGFYGAKFHMVYENYSQIKLNEYYKTLEYYGFPLIIHAKFANKGDQIKRILKIAPNIKIILAHMGRGHIFTDEMIDDLLLEFKDVQNLYFETSTVGRSRMIEHACRLIGAQRLMFGSDFPFGKAWFKDAYSYEDDLDTINLAHISDEEKEWVFHKTIETIIDSVDKKRNSCLVRKIFKDDVKGLLDKIDNISIEDRQFLAFDKKSSLIRKCIRECNHIYVAVDKEKIVGFFRESGRLNNQYVLEEFLVFQEYRGQGYSKKMLEYFNFFFPNSLVKTKSNNIRMHHILQNFGFLKKKEGSRIIEWVSKNGISQ